MTWLFRHLRNKLGAGMLAAIPLIVLVAGATWIESHTRPIADLAGLSLPGFGVILAVVGAYLLGLIVTSIVGRIFLFGLDRFLEHVPGFHHLYHAWKEVVVLSPARASMFHQVVLASSGDGKNAQIGFTSGDHVPGDPHTVCVFLPNIPNPLSGRLTLFQKSCCVPLKLSVAEAFKFLLSTGNYVPPDLEGLSVRESGEEAKTVENR
jgi:uncharacterized membrane protein